MLCSIDWLEINSTEVFFNIFTFGEPVYGTSNINYLEELINSKKPQTLQEHIECKITHIGKEKEDLLVYYLKKGYLCFNPSSKP